MVSLHTRSNLVFNQCVGIWFGKVDVAAFNQRASRTCAEFLGIEVVEVGQDFVRAKMPVTERNRQPMGIVNGGANVVLAESICSAAANFCVDQEQFRCVGLEVNANHIRPAFEGSTIVALCRPVHLGKTTQVWEAKLEVDAKLSCLCRLTLAVVKKERVERGS